ncbi:hypothetical protein B0H16DRAFT_1829494 [Mycena metata]|uniref:Uncharacterized protein n=1 Tax=Mycena metata TaxID=1033252 RepID=A0AAD7GRN0_9AGAR|nr:hypothetical protein B0H16DRAFT_1829494 [Mycena metata]
MPRQQTATEVRLHNISKCATITLNILDVLVDSLKISGLEAMINTTQLLLKMVRTIKQDKKECAELMEQTHVILSAIINVYIKSDTGTELPPSTLNKITNFTQHNKVAAKLKFFRQGELNTLLKDCNRGLEEGIKFFQIISLDIVFTARKMEEQAQIRYQVVFNTIETLSSSDSASTQDVFWFICKVILNDTGHCVNDVWELFQSRKEVEEFLSLLADISSLALLITMRGVERPSKVQWTRPFLRPLEPLSQDAARKVFIDIAEDRHPIEEVDQVLCLADNMPLSISLLAHAVDVEGSTTILVCWQGEHTSVISEGYDHRSNPELSISLSLASPRITSTPHSQEVLSLLSILLDGLGDAELKQSNFAIQGYP